MSDSLPGYDAWKTDPGPAYDGPTPAQEREMEEREAEQIADLREQLEATFADYRGDLYLATIREVVVDELNKLRPGAGEPEWQTRTPVPMPVRG
jgi:hypothetical protein